MKSHYIVKARAVFVSSLSRAVQSLPTNETNKLALLLYKNFPRAGKTKTMIMGNVLFVRKSTSTSVYKQRFRTLRCLLLLASYLLICPAISFSQQDSVRSYKAIDNGHVVLSIKSYCKKKKQISQDVRQTALKQALFSGIPNTIYAKPLFPEGETVALRAHRDYFVDLIGKRSGDFLKIKQISDFKKGGKDAEGKYTLFEVVINVLQIRRDLEQNKIIKRIGF